MTDVRISLSVANTLLIMHRCDAGIENCSAHRELREAIEVAGSQVPDAEQAWPLRDVLKTLADFANYQLSERAYDGHGHEALQLCVNRAREILASPPDAAEVLRLREWLEGIREIALRSSSEAGYIYIDHAVGEALAGKSENYQYRTKKEG